MRSTLLVAAALAFGAPALTLGAAPALAKVAHSHAEAKAPGLTATFHFNQAADAKYTCEMHPQVEENKPGQCPLCGMNLVKQTHTVGLALLDAHQKAITAAKVKFVIKDARGAVEQEKPAGGTGYFKANFCLPKGKHTVSAVVTPAGQKQATTVSVPYEAK
jgi:hypothetical protein